MSFGLLGAGFGRQGVVGQGRRRVLTFPSSLFGAGDMGDWWDVSDLSALFKDTAGTTPCTADGDLVARVNGKKNGHNLLQATSSKQPVLRNSGSLWWLVFDGVDDFLQANYTLNQPVTKVTAAQQVTWVNTRRPWGGGGANPNSFLIQNGTSPNLSMYSGSVGPTTTGMTVNANHVVTEIVNGASSKLAVDNGSYATGDAGTNNPSGTNVGDAGPTLPANILFFGKIDIGRVLTDPEIASCRTFFGAKAGLSL